MEVKKKLTSGKMIEKLNKVFPNVYICDSQITFQKKILYTFGVFFVFFLGQLPIFTIKNKTSEFKDPFYSIRPIFCMEKFSFFEMGFLPLITSWIFWGLSFNLKFHKANLNSIEHKRKFYFFQKLTTILLTFIYTLIFLFSGYFDSGIKNFENVSTFERFFNYVLIFFQINLWSLFVVLLTEMLDKIYGFENGIMSLMSINVALNFLIDLIGIDYLTTQNSNTETSKEYVGIFFRILLMLPFLSKRKTIEIFKSLFMPSQHSNIIQIVISITLFIITVYLSNIVFQYPIKNIKIKESKTFYPLKLIYTGCLPLLFSYALLANLQIIFYFIFSLSKRFHFFDYLTFITGRFNYEEKSKLIIPISGLSYLLSGSTSIKEALFSPFKSFFFFSYITATSVLFVRKWSTFYESSPKNVYNKLKDFSVSSTGKRDSVLLKELTHLIQIALVDGVFFIASLASISDLLIGFGKGPAIMICVLFIFSFLETFFNEKKNFDAMNQFLKNFNNELKTKL